MPFGPSSYDHGPPRAPDARGPMSKLVVSLMLAQGPAGGWTDVYGVGVSTLAVLLAGASLAWQVIQHRQKGKPRAEVNWRLAVVGPAPEHGLPEPVPSLSVKVVNRDDAAVNVSMVGLIVQDGSGDQWLKNPYDRASWDTLPGKVEPRDAGEQFIPLALLVEYGFDIDKPIVAYANLGTGEQLRSRPLVRGGRVRGRWLRSR